MLSGTAAWGGARVKAPRKPRGSQLPADPLHRDPPAPHVHFASKPLKGIPWVLFYVHWPPRLWSHDPVCFHGVEVIILWSCCVMRLIQKFVWSFTRTLNVTLGHRPNILDLYKPRQILTGIDNLKNIPSEVYFRIRISQTSKIYSLCERTLASMVGSSFHAQGSATNLIKSPWRRRSPA